MAQQTDHIPDVKVYVVMGGWDFEGYSKQDMKAFNNILDAEKYVEDLKNREYPFDYVSVFEMEVN